MRITVLGASGNIGQRVTKLLLEHGHEVVAMVHSKDLPGLDSAKLHVIKGDVHNPGDINKAISGSDAVVSTLGSWGTKTKDIVAAATKNLIPAMQKAGINRFVSITGSGACLPGEAKPISLALTRLLLKTLQKPVLTDAEKHLRLLNESNLDWTALRSPVMTNKSLTSYVLRLKPFSPLANISRQAITIALVEVIEKNTFSKQAPFISAK
ncbi:MAG: NmrA family protein [Candidatus Saccharibacteria bacterium]|nr:NmrA family protein [Candidatus Saccharibacteria bacterium]